MTPIPNKRHQSDGRQEKEVEGEPLRSRDRNLAALHQNVIENVDDAVNALNIRADHSGANIFPFSVVLYGIWKKEKTNKHRNKNSYPVIRSDKANKNRKERYRRITIGCFQTICKSGISRMATGYWLLLDVSIVLPRVGSPPSSLLASDKLTITYINMTV